LKNAGGGGGGDIEGTATLLSVRQLMVLRTLTFRRASRVSVVERHRT